VQQYDLVAIPLFEATHPGCQGLFLFDNSKSHGIMAPDALVVSLTNVFPGGAQPHMRDGWYMKEGERVMQPMSFVEGETVLVGFKAEKKGDNAGKTVLAGAIVESSSWFLGTAKGMKQVCSCVLCEWKSRGLLVCLFLTPSSPLLSSPPRRC
jgi:hypothetical protein